MRARVWHRVEIVHRAAIDVVQRILEKGDEGFVARIKKSLVVGAMVKRAIHHLLRVLQGVPQELPFRLRAMVEGTRIVREKISICRERGVFNWAPWLKEWLAERDTVYFLGLSSLHDRLQGRRC
jgi:predicted thioesterase